MDGGIISSRYATALLKLVAETGRGQAVYEQVEQMLAAPDSIPQPLEPDLEKFVALLVKRGRTEYLKPCLITFVSKYREQQGIRVAHLVTAVEAPGLEERVRDLFKDCRLEFDSRIDPSIIGGFVLTVDDVRIDASVSRQLETIRKEFIEKNLRIV